MLALGAEVAPVAGLLSAPAAPSALLILTGATPAPGEGLLGSPFSRNPLGGAAPREGALSYLPGAPTGLAARGPSALPPTTAGMAALARDAGAPPDPLTGTPPAYGALRSAPPTSFPLGGLSSVASIAAGVGPMMLLTLAGFLVLGTPWTRRRLRFARESRWPAPFALMPERPG